MYTNLGKTLINRAYILIGVHRRRIIFGGNERRQCNCKSNKNGWGSYVDRTWLINNEKCIFNNSAINDESQIQKRQSPPLGKPPLVSFIYKSFSIYYFSVVMSRGEKRIIYKKSFFLYIMKMFWTYRMEWRCANSTEELVGNWDK